MPDFLLLAIAFLFGTCGMAWLALAMKGHWQQVKGDTVLADGTAVALRSLGVFALLVSWSLYVSVAPVSMASLAWIMSLGVSALAVTLTLTWRPRSLAWLASVACATRLLAR